MRTQCKLPEPLPKMMGSASTHPQGVSYYPPGKAEQMSWGKGPPLTTVGKDTSAECASKREDDDQSRRQLAAQQELQKRQKTCTDHGVSTTVSPESPQYSDVETCEKKHRIPNRAQEERGRSRTPRPHRGRYLSTRNVDGEGKSGKRAQSWEPQQRRRRNDSREGRKEPECTRAHITTTFRKKRIPGGFDASRRTI